MITTPSRINRFIKTFPKQEELVFFASSNSMKPTIERGDRIVVKIIPYSTAKIGDVGVFLINHTSIVLIHRIIDISKKGKRHVFSTKGDSNKLKDDTYLTQKNFVGVVVSVQHPAGRRSLFDNSHKPVLNAFRQKLLDIFFYLFPGGRK